MKRIGHLAAVILTWVALGAWGQAAPDHAAAPVAVPPLGQRATDLTGTLSADDLGQLESSLRDFEARKGSQIAVLIVPTTQPETIEQYGIRVADAWKLGRKKVDDGAILIIAKNDRTLRIEVGYGLEGALNDAVCERIISEIIVPELQQGDFAQGVKAGVNAILQVVNGEPLPAARPISGVRPGDNYHTLLPLALMAILFVGGLLRAILGRLPGAIVAGGLIGLATWFLFHLLFVGVLLGIVAFFITLFAGSLGAAGMMLGGMGGGGGGGGGGGFSGGGGGFGGGGASGRW
jgi:uncharacterized protein